MRIFNSAGLFWISLLLLLETRTSTEGRLPRPAYRTQHDNSSRLLPQYRPKGTRPPRQNPFFGRKKASVKEHAIVNGEYRETNRILIQRETRRGIEYAPFGNRKKPIFIRKEKERNRKYVIFQDPHLPPGEGYLVVLKRIPLNMAGAALGYLHGEDVGQMNGAYPIPQEVAYEAFHILLSNNVHGSVDHLNVRKMAYRIRTDYSGRKYARRKFAEKRRRLSQARRRFAIAKWRGKRSIHTLNPTVLKSLKAFRKNGMLPRGKVAITFGGNSRLGPCAMTPMNMTEIRLRVELRKKAAMEATEKEDWDFIDYD